MYHGAQYQTQFYPSGAMTAQQAFDAASCYPSPPVSPLPTRQRTHLELYVPHLIQEKVLGNGAYGVVYLARDVNTGRQYAVKALNKFVNGRPVDVRTQQFQRTELELHFRASAHPNVVSLLEVRDTPTITYVVLEYCPEGDLFTNITEAQRYTNKPQDAKAVFLQILDAVAHCHNMSIFHRDLKPENILVSQSGNQVKLADFGLATTEPVSRDFGCGSTFYMSPECHDTSDAKPFYLCAPNDIWSLGVILVNLTCGRNPWKVASKRDSTYKAFLQDKNFLREILPLSEELNEILKMIFTEDPAQRITLPELRARIFACSSFNKLDTTVMVAPTPVYPCDAMYFNQVPANYVHAFSQKPSMAIDSYQASRGSFDAALSPSYSNTSRGSSDSYGSMESMESDHSDSSSTSSGSFRQSPTALSTGYPLNDAHYLGFSFKQSIATPAIVGHLPPQIAEY